MFKNIGKKIMSLAKALCYIGIAFSIITAVSAFIVELQFVPNKVGYIILLVILAILTAALGTFFAWISSFKLYGFGQLIDNSQLLVNQGKEKAEKRKACLEETP